MTQFYTIKNSTLMPVAQAQALKTIYQLRNTIRTGIHSVEFGTIANQHYCYKMLVQVYNRDYNAHIELLNNLNRGEIMIQFYAVKNSTVVAQCYNDTVYPFDGTRLYKIDSNTGIACCVGICFE